METSSQPQQRVTNLPAPRSARYLSDFLQEGLPQNCLFDKALTGCGGTYVALTCDKPYIVAVPTKALVKDKIENPTYLAKGFKVGEKYSSKEVKDTLTRLGIPKAKAVFIKRWFEVKEVQVFKERGYRIIRKL